MTESTRARCRLDELLVERGLMPSRAQANATIRAGDVVVDGRLSDKPGMLVRRDADVQLRPARRYVGRGGVKLAAALDHLGWPVEGAVALDVGASTGGFTDCLLQRGARHVYAVDVGRGQLAWSLRMDPRVTNLERVDIRALDTLPEPPSLATIDVAFISLRLVLPAVARLVAPGAGVVALVKPQFEAGRGDVGRGGIVRDGAVHRRVLTEVLAAAVHAGWRVEDVLPSPIAGADGNLEFLAALRAPSPPDGADDDAARVDAADIAARIESAVTTGSAATESSDNETPA